MSITTIGAGLSKRIDCAHCGALVEPGDMCAGCGDYDESTHTRIEARRGWWMQHNGRVAYLCDQIDGWWYGRAAGGSPAAWRIDGSPVSHDAGLTLCEYLGNECHAPLVSNNGYTPEKIACPTA